MLAMHPKIQDQVYTEIQLLASSDDNHFTYENVSKLTYMEMVFKESMRLFPVPSFLARVTTKETKLNNCTLPAGTNCIIPVFKLQRSRELWGHNADRFDPERFSTEQIKNYDLTYFLPFSAGPRDCIGRRYAMISMKIFLCHLLLRFRFETEMKLDELEFSHEVFLKLLNEYTVTVIRR